jgi:leucyl-tRNA synthetase
MINQSSEANIVYDTTHFEEKVQKLWKDFSAFDAKISSEKKCYILEMLPYPSGNLHAGHIRNYTIGDILSRFKKHKGFNILHPIGFDAFGLPAENAAIKGGKSPLEWTNENISEMLKILKKIGFSYDYKRLRKTHEPEYYKHEQEFFLKLFRKGLVYKKKSIVNWDPVDMTVLANEQVINGRGWRSDALVEKKELSQWFLKISEYSQALLDGIENDLIEWPEKVKVMQKNWIGKSEGVNIFFDILDEEKNLIESKKLEVFTTRPETIFGASFICINPKHEIIAFIKKNKNLDEFLKICQEQEKVTSEELEKAEKLGFFTGLYANHPFIKEEKLPIYIANFVLENYGSGAIFSNPTHDKRDFEFAQKYNIKIKNKIFDCDDSLVLNEEACKNSKIINSDFLNNLSSVEAKKKIISKIETSLIGFKKINYKLRDWGLSRQRYWGCPIPIIYCDNCGIVEETNLPVKLPNNIKDFSSIKGNPLCSNDEFIKTKCPNCKNENARRETDTLDTFFESSWYFVSYANQYGAMDNKENHYWLPVDYYIGGIEHAILHLLYARFFNILMFEESYVPTKEPFKKLYTQGMVCHKTYKNSENNNWLSPEEYNSLDKNEKLKIIIGPSEKMSKSKKNIVEPVNIMKDFGVDAMRFFIVSDTPPDKDFEWSADGISGCSKFLKKLFNFFISSISIFNLSSIKEIDDSYILNNELLISKNLQYNEKLKKLFSLLQILNSQISNDIECFYLNSSIARIRTFANFLFDLKLYENENFFNNNDEKRIFKYILKSYLIILEPFIPHVSQILFEYLLVKNINNKIITEEYILYFQKWPMIFDNFIIKETINISININGKYMSKIEINEDLSDDEIKELSFKKLLELSKIPSDKNISDYKYIYVKNKIINFIKNNT